MWKGFLLVLEGHYIPAVCLLKCCASLVTKFERFQCYTQTWPTFHPSHQLIPMLHLCPWCLFRFKTDLLQRSSESTIIFEKSKNANILFQL